MNVGKITQVIGPVIDVEFAEGRPSRDPLSPADHKPRH